MTDTKTTSLTKRNRTRCILAIVFCSLIAFLVFLAVCDQLLSKGDEIVSEVGWKSYHMFTILANMFEGIAAAMCIPYAVDGLRYNNYHLPRWIVNLLFTATTGVALTFLIAVTVLSPMTSYYRMMLYSNNILFHTTVPIMAMILFLFINSDHRVRFKDTFITIVPAALYAVLYYVMVFIIGESNGGWRDHYQIMEITKHVPLPVVVIGVLAIDFIVASLLRIGHNMVHRKKKANDRDYYQNVDLFDKDDIEEAIAALAKENRNNDLGGELIVPRRVINMMEDKYKSGLPLGELCEHYVRAYYEHEREQKQ